MQNPNNEGRNAAIHDPIVNELKGLANNTIYALSKSYSTISGAWYLAIKNFSNSKLSH